MDKYIKVPVIIYKEGNTFTAEYIGIKNIEYGYSTMEELKKDFIKGIERGIEGLKEHSLKISDSENMVKELQEALKLQEFNIVQSVEFIEYNFSELRI